MNRAVRLLAFVSVGAIAGLAGCGSDRGLVPKATDPLRAVVDAGTKLESVLEGFRLADGPVWTRNGCLLLSDTLANRLYLWDEPSPVVIFRSPSGYPAGNEIDDDGRLVTAQHDRTVTRTDERGRPRVIADRHAGRPLNGPNDVAVGPGGRLYFVDPTFALTGEGPVRDDEEQSVRGIYRVGIDGAAELVASHITMPNGIAFSPDRSRLYVTDAADDTLHRYSVDHEGNVGAHTRIAALTRALGQRGVANGIAVDRHGTVFVVGPGGLWIFDEADRLLGKIAVPEPPTDVELGGRDGRQLFITAESRVYRLRLTAGRTNR